MRVIIAGSRTITDYSIVEKAVIASGFNVTEIISGGAKGVDRLGELWAKINGVKLSRFQADWNTYGRVAGFIRNAEMLKFADALIVVWDGKSRGTFDILSKARKRCLPVYLEVYKNE